MPHPFQDDMVVSSPRVKMYEKIFIRYFDPEHRITMLSGYIGNQLPYDAASHARRTWDLKLIFI
jgi:hypothetical protein